jgi:hypothetical protein
LNPARTAVPAAIGQTYTFTLTDTKGAADFGIVDVLVDNFLDGRQSCYLAYIASSKTLLLIDDAGDAGGPFAGNMVLNGGAAIIQNSQCAVNGALSSVSAVGTTLSLALNIAFKSAGNRDRLGGRPRCRRRQQQHGLAGVGNGEYPTMKWEGRVRLRRLRRSTQSSDSQSKGVYPFDLAGGRAHSSHRVY